MEFTELQARVHRLNQRIGGEWQPQWQLLWLFEELGELSREMQKKEKLPAKLHTDNIETIHENIKEEFGDVIYGIISLSKSLGLDILDCLEYSIEKFEERHNSERN